MYAHIDGTQTVCNSIIFEVLTIVKKLMLVFWVVTTYGLVGKPQRW
jgi:hypothetical protein